ncbi:M23 family metallopeptidase [Brevibacterium linens]|uniref:M23 family metallopeptidase n=1 Tax=Brevibacterium linens TaxID=1703 RepID=UPI001F31E565|nr:M23 family metallopeptidase [Brevibacterium linens]
MAVLVVVMCVLLSVLVPRWPATPPGQVVHPPVQGRWLGMNSPVSKVPSHGVRVYGQTYAIDLVHDPDGTPRPTFGGPIVRAAHEYPAFGQPVFAMVTGTVVRASDWRRDHRARSNWFGLIYLMVEGAVREIGGPGFIVGNHVTIRTDDSVYATIAHLQRRSITVQVGDRVTAGTRIGACGNSGNSSEPHVHAQLMDRMALWTAQGVPMVFADITLDTNPEKVDALPKNEQRMTSSIVPQQIGGHCDDWIGPE